jgi:hypothetical protein
MQKLDEHFIGGHPDIAKISKKFRIFYRQTFRVHDSPDDTS